LFSLAQTGNRINQDRQARLAKLPARLNPCETTSGVPFKLFGHDTELAIQAFNLFNDVHREVPGGDLSERRVSGTLRYRF